MCPPHRPRRFNDRAYRAGGGRVFVGCWPSTSLPTAEEKIHDADGVGALAATAACHAIVMGAISCWQ